MSRQPAATHRCFLCGAKDRPLSLNYDGSATCIDCEAREEAKRQEEHVAEVFCDDDDWETE